VSVAALAKAQLAVGAVGFAWSLLLGALGVPWPLCLLTAIVLGVKAGTEEIPERVPPA
jgi:hypothetical protein